MDFGFRSALYLSSLLFLAGVLSAYMRAKSYLSYTYGVGDFGYLSIEGGQGRREYHGSMVAVIWDRVTD